MSDLVAALAARLTAVEARLAVLESGAARGNPPATAGGAVADDADLDSDWGDEVIKKDPKRWLDKGGDSYAGCKMSECPAGYLREFASLCDWMARKDEEQGKTYTHNKTGKEEPTAPFARKRAARARGWALRAEQRETQAASSPSNGAGRAPQSDRFANDEIPF